MKKGQSWSVDYTIGLLMFIIAISISASLLGDVFNERSFEALLQDANRLSEAIVSEGYPTNWDDSDIIRAGILYDGRLSWRKLGLLHEMTVDEYNTILPSGYNFAFALTTPDNETLGYADECSFGNERLPKTTTAQNNELAIGYYYRDEGPNELYSWANLRGASIYKDEEIIDLLNNIHEYGLVILEDPQLNNTLNTTLTATRIREEFREAAKYGTTIALTGMFGTPILGANTTLSFVNGNVTSHNEPYFLLNETDALNFTTNYELSFMPEQGGLLGNLDGSRHQQTIVEESGIKTSAVWQYEDSRVYYFSDTEGEYDGDSWSPILEQGLSRTIQRSSVNCTVEPELITTPDLVKIDRLVADRGQILTLSLYVWRNP